MTTTQRRNLINGMARESHKYSRWQVAQGRAPVPARRLTKAQAERREPGFVYHGALQADRTDPTGPRDVFPWAQFLTEYRRLESGGTTPAAPLEGDIMTPYQFWAYVSEKVDKRQVYRILRDTDANAEDVQKRIRRNDWADWLGARIGNIRTKPDSSLTNRWSGLRKDGYRLSTWSQYAYLWARRSYDMAQQARNEAREVKAMVRAQAKTQDEVLKGQGVILKAVEDAERETIRVNAAEVAEELEIAVREDAEADQEDES